MKKLEKKLKKHLNNRIIYFIRKHFEDNDIKPILENVKLIGVDVIEASFLSVPSMYELMLYQQIK